MSEPTGEYSLDELAKKLATGTLSRGKALRWMGGALLGAALASVPGVAWANDDCRRLGRECRRDSQCCSRNCIRRGDEKVCGCPEGQTLCKKPRGEGRCVNLKTNERHCGSCFNRCAEGEECVGGTCAAACISNGRGPCTTNDECCSGNCDSSGFCLPPTGPNRVDCFCSNSTQVSSCTSLQCSDDAAIRSFVCNPLCAINGASTDSVVCGANACA
jgi:Stigma-specific protein, Stig1